MELDRHWIGLLSEVLDYGVSTGEFALADVRDFAVRFSALMDGLMLQVVAGSVAMDRERMLEICARAGAELRG